MFSKKLLYKVYSKTGTFLGVLSDVVSDLSITKQINGGDSEFKILLSRKFDDFDEGNTISFNNRIKVYLQDKYNTAGTTLVANGYIVSYSPYLKEKEEGLEITCLSAVSKLSNDFYRAGTNAIASELGIELENMRADEMMEAIITHYRSTEANSMISNDFTNVEQTTDIDGNPASFTYRFFNMKHLAAIKETAKFLPKYVEGGHWQYWRIETDGKLWVKTLNTSADHSFIIGKHITSIAGNKTFEETVNRVYFWNEKGTADPDYLKFTDDDLTSQSSYDIISDYVTDSKITNETAATMLTNAKLYDNSGPQVQISITLSGQTYDLASIKPGQTCSLFNAKNNPYVAGANNVLLIESITYTVDEAILQLSNGHVNLEDMIEEERQLLDKQLAWFGYITQQLTASQLAPVSRAWSTDILFSATTGGDKYRQVDWSSGTVWYASNASNSGKRVIIGGNTGIMSASTNYYIYLNETTINTSASTDESGTGIIQEGGDILNDASKAWTVNEWQGYIVTIGGQTRIIRSNTATILTLEESWTIADATAAYVIKKMSFDATTDLESISLDASIVFANARANTKTASEAIVVTTDNTSTIESLALDGQSQIAERSISYDRIIANTITANEINTSSISIGSWSGSLDDVDDGVSYFKTTANQKNGGGYAYSGLNSNGYVKIPVDSTKMTSGVVPATGIFIDSTGIYGRKSGNTVFSMLVESGSAYFAGEIGASSISGNLTTTQWIIFKYGATTVANIYANAAGSVLISGAPTDSTVFVNGKGTGSASLGVDSDLFFYASGNSNANISTKDIIPTTGNDLGADGNEWELIFANEITSQGDINVGVNDGGFLNLKAMTGDAADLLPSQNGSMYYRTTDATIRVKLGGSWFSLATL